MRRWGLVGLLLLAHAVCAPACRGTAAQTACYTPQEAAAHAGEYACVSGQITRVFWAQQSNGRPTFIDFGRAFTVIIWEEDRPWFVTQAVR